ncbi:MAG: class I SAM-dependent methyltransferase [Spartobacteria bacterium]
MPLNPESLIKAIDPEQFEMIRRRHAIEDPGIAWPKYLNLQKWMSINLRRIRALKLDCGFRKRILDLGCGAGLFLFIAQTLGHDVLGLDIDEVPMFAEMMLLLGLRRVTWRVRPFVKLPPTGKRFDLITAFMICFNGHKSPELWGREEWKSFLDDLQTRLTPRGRICLGFNKEDEGGYYNADLRDFFANRQAEFLPKGLVILPAEPDAPRAIR